jgi:hypothetical protein
VDGGLSFLFREILYTGNPLNNWMGTVNAYVFGTGVIFLLFFILAMVWILLLDDTSMGGCVAKVAGPLFGVVCLITYVIFTLLVPDIIVAFKTNRFLYYAGSIILIIDGAAGKLLSSALEN